MKTILTQIKKALEQFEPDVISNFKDKPECAQVITIRLAFGQIEDSIVCAPRISHTAAVKKTFDLEQISLFASGGKLKGRQAVIDE